MVAMDSMEEPMVSRGRLGDYLREAAAQMRMMLPLASGNLINYAVTFVTLHVVGSEGTTAVAAVGLALALYTCLGRNLIMGLCGAVDTISAQAAGAQRLDLLGPIYRRSCLFLLLHLPPFGLFCLSTLLWLPLLTDPLVAHSSSRFLLLLLPDLAAQCVWRPMNRVLASQRITCPFMVVSLLVLLCHYFFCRFFVWHFGALGAAVATSCSGLVTLLLATAAVQLVGQAGSIWGGQATPRSIKEAACGWTALAKLAYPSMAMRMLESSGFSGVVAASALLPLAKVEVDVMSLSLNAYGCFFSLFPALSICCDTRVGNAVGRGDGSAAVQALRVAAALTVPLATLVSLVFVIPAWKRLLENVLRVHELDPRVAEGLNAIFLIFVCGFYYIDGLQTALSGAIRGTGQQQNGACICVLAYWILGIPAALAMGFGGLRATGLWLGMLVGPLVQLILYARLLWKLNWEHVAQRCEERLVR